MAEPRRGKRRASRMYVAHVGGGHSFVLLICCLCLTHVHVHSPACPCVHVSVCAPVVLSPYPRLCLSLSSRPYAGFASALTSPSIHPSILSSFLTASFIQDDGASRIVHPLRIPSPSHCRRRNARLPPPQTHTPFAGPSDLQQRLVQLASDFPAEL